MSDTETGPGCWPVGFEKTASNRIREARREQMERDCRAVKQFLGSMVMPHLSEDIINAIRRGRGGEEMKAESTIRKQMNLLRKLSVAGPYNSSWAHDMATALQWVLEKTEWTPAGLIPWHKRVEK